MPDESAVPRWRVRARIQVDPSALSWVGASGFRDLANAYNPSNQQYKPIGPMSWKLAKTLLDLEGELIREAALRAGSPKAFGDRLDELAEERQTRELLGRLESLDLGVISPVSVLCASGCVTFNSCSGHEDYPRVQFYVPLARRRDYLDVLRESCTSSLTGLVNDAEGRLELFGSSVVRMWRFSSSFLEVARKLKLRHVPETRKRNDKQLMLPGFVLKKGRLSRADVDAES